MREDTLWNRIKAELTMTKKSKKNSVQELLGSVNVQ